MRKRILQRGLAMALSAAMLLTGIQFPSITAQAADLETVVFVDDMEDKTTAESGWNLVWQDEANQGTEERAANQWATDANANKTVWWSVKTEKAANVLTITRTISGLKAGQYKASIDADGGNISGKISITNGTDTVDKDIEFSTQWSIFTTTQSDLLTLTDTSDVTFTIMLDSLKEGWCDLDNIKLIHVMNEEEEKNAALNDLSALIAECKAFKQSDYLPNGFQALQAEIKTAQGVYNTAASKTKEEIIAAHKKLQAAKDNLICSVMPEDAGIFVEKVENLAEDFVRGVDISTYKSLIDSGVKFRDWDGNVLDEVGFFQLLKSAGVNYVRIRVWNDPYADAEKKQGYGAGNCDVAKAAQMGAWATQAGLRVMIDFHYSDFWADPGRQVAPKAWKNFTADQKAEAVKTFTKESLQTIIAAGADVGMVQVGNETTSSVCGLRNWDDMVKIFKAGCAAVKEVDPDILRALHFTNPEKTSTMKGFADKLNTSAVDYDVFASSYYPYWHGTRENLTSVLKYVADKYNKKVMVAETSWARTFEDGDGQPNVVRVGQNDDTSEYSASPQGQASEVRDVIQAVANVGEAGIGVMYWEPAWLPVHVYNKDAADASEVLAANKAAWETYGSGWASSYSIDYDPNVNENNYGGSEWDNQAMFDFEGNPLPSLNVYKYVYSGAKGQKKLISVEESSATISTLDDIASKLPTTVTGVFNDSSKEQVSNVTWSKDDIAAIKDFGTHTINGTVTYTPQEGEAVTVNAICKVEYYPENLLLQGDFEEGRDKWKIEGTGLNSKTTENPRSGKYCVAFWLEQAYELTVSQSITVEKPGTFGAFMFMQGGDADDAVKAKIQLSNDTQSVSSEAEAGARGWVVWQMPSVGEFVPAAVGDTLTVKITITGTAGSWGSIDDVYLYQKEAASYYTITYHNMEGAKNPNPATYDGTKDIVLAAPTREGYTFEGWFTDSAFTNKVDKIAKDTTGDQELYAKWKENTTQPVEKDKISSITVTPGKATLQTGKTLTLAAVIAPESADKEAVTWETSNAKVATVTNGVVKAVGSGQAVITLRATDGSGVKASCTITVPYKIAYKLNGGTNNKSNPSEYYNRKITLKNPTRKNYTFGGWYTDSKFKNKVTSIAQTSRKDIILYAKWQKVSVKKAAVQKVTNSGKKKAKVIIKKVSGAKGYKVQYCTSKKFKKGVKSKSTTKRTITLSGLKKGRTYYVRVCAYKLDSKKGKVYGKYGAAKKVTIRK